MRGNENDVSIVEFAEKICGSELPAWQKEALIKIIQLDRPVYITLKKQSARGEMIQACQKLMEILYGHDI